MSASVLATSVANSFYLWGAVAVAVIAIATALRQGALWLKRDGVRDSKVDALIKANVPERLKGIEDKLGQLVESTKANGGDSDQVGDIAKRIETAQTGMQSSLDQHIGQCVAEQKQNKDEHRDFKGTLKSHGRQIRDLANRGA